MCFELNTATRTDVALAVAITALVTSLGCSNSKDAPALPQTTEGPASLMPSGGTPPSSGTAPPAPAPASLALTPPMGFNDWNAFGCNVSEDLIKATADFFVSSGLKEAGYKFVNIDDCWALKDRAADGTLVPDPAKFPSGIKGVADYVHGLGLQLGIYGDAGTLTCAGYPGSLGHEEVDARTFSAWGVDYLKYDNCSNQSDGSREDFVRRYTAMRTALDHAGRAIVYSICEWGQSQPWQWATNVGNLWRTTGDITDSWSSLRSIIAANAALTEYAGPGHWNDPDMLEIGNGGMTLTEYRTHMSLWSMMAAPLIIGTDLRKASPETLAILSNADVIALDQDALGKQASVLSDTGSGLLVLEKPLSSGESALALYNGSDAPAVISIPASSTALGTAAQYRLRDIWSGVSTEAATTIAAGVPAHGTVVYEVSPLAVALELPPSLSVGASLGTIIAGSTDGALLSSSVTNHGTSDATEVDLSIGAPDGWLVTAATGSTGDSIATERSSETTWNVQVPAGASPGTYPLSITVTYGWGSGQKATATNELSAKVVVPPPNGMTPLSVLMPVSSSNGAGPVEIDMSNGGQTAGDGNLISIGGTYYTRGLGTNAASKIVYYLGGRCSTLTTNVGIDDDVTSGGSASFAVYADDRVVAQSGVLGAGEPAQTLTADLTGATLLQLVADPGDTNGSDHADWAAPQIVCGGSTTPTTNELILFSFEDGTENWTISNPAAGGNSSASPAFHTDGTQGLVIVSPADGNWFGKTLPTPLDLSGKTSIAFDLKTGDVGTSAEFAVQTGAAWCQGGLWTWTNPSSSRTIERKFTELSCPAGTSMDLTQVSAVWVFVKGGTFDIDRVRAE